jgi:putative ATPase
MPEDLQGTLLYHPVTRGLEIRIGERLAQLRQLNDEARRSEPTGNPPATDGTP